MSINKYMFSMYCVCMFMCFGFMFPEKKHEKNIGKTFASIFYYYYIEVNKKEKNS